MPAPNLTTFGARLGYWLETYADTQEATLKTLDISYSTFRRMISDPLAKPKTGLLLRVHRAFPTCNLEWLLNGTQGPLWESNELEKPNYTVFNHRLDYLSRYEFLKRCIPLLTDAGKAALVSEALDLMVGIHQGNAELLKAIQELENLLGSQQA